MSIKPKPAPIEERGADNRITYRLHFCYRGKRYRSKRIRDQHTANILQSRINTLITEFKNGLVTLPANRRLPDFIFEEVVPSAPAYPEVTPPTVVSLSDLIEAYQAYAQPPVKAHSTCETEKIHLSHLRHFMDKHGDPVLDAIDVAFFDKYKQHRAKQGVRTDTVNKELGTFQVMFRHGVKHRFLKSNIIREVDRDKSETPSTRFRTHAEAQELLQHNCYQPGEVAEIKRYRYLSVTEIERLISLAKGSWLHPILLVLAWTGMRRGEIVKLEWADVDMQHEILSVGSSKQSRTKKEAARRVEMSPEVVAVLKQQKLKTGQERWVFPSVHGKQLSTDSLQKAFQKLVEATEFEGLGFHVFRHSMASNLAAQGTDQRVINDMLGHQTVEMQERYRHRFPQKMSEALRNLKSSGKN